MYITKIPALLCSVISIFLFISIVVRFWRGNKELENRTLNDSPLGGLPLLIHFSKKEDKEGRKSNGPEF